MSPPDVATDHRLYCVAEADLGAGWYAGWTIDADGDVWPFVLDSHVEGWLPVLYGDQLDAAAPHEVV